MAGIPLHITPLSYIRGNGSQYIETEIYLRSTDVVKSKWRFEGAAGNVYGCFSGSSEDDNFCLYAGSSSVFAYIRYNGQLVRDFKATNGTIYEIEQGPDGFKTDGVNASFTTATFTCSAPMYIFMLPNSTSAKVTARCYGLTVYRDGEQVYNFIPARNELTSEVGLFEAVNGVWYGNAGTGTFTAGDDLNYALQPLLLKRRRALLGVAKHMEPKPASDGKIWAYYDVTDTSAPTSLFNTANNITAMKIDGVSVPVSQTYQFSETGEHLVKMTTSGHGTAGWWLGSTAVKRIYIPNHITNIGNNVFRGGCGAYLIDWPDTITSVLRSSLYANSTVRSLVIRAINPPTLDNVLYAVSADLKIFVPYSADHSILTAYQSASNWSANASQFYELNPDGTIPTA